MKTILLLSCSLALLLAPSCWATAFTASVTGNWNNSATWGGAGIPGSGDTAVINNSVTVTVPSGYTAVIGTSPTDDTGAVALAASNTSSGTGILHVAGGGTLKWQGPLRTGVATWTFDAGSHLQYDATGAANPATALYTFQTAQAGVAGSLILFNGTSGSHVLVDSASNIASGGIVNNATGWADGGSVESHYTDFKYQGAATTTGAIFSGNSFTSTGKLILDHDTLDNCAQILYTLAAGAGNFSMSYTHITNPTNSAYTLQLAAQNVKTTGTRLITFSVIPDHVSILGTADQSNGFAYTHNVNYRYFSSTSDFFTLSNGEFFDTWDDNLIFNSNNQVRPFATLTGGVMDHTYLMNHCDPNPTCARPHDLFIGPAGLNTEIVHLVVDGDSGDDGGALTQLQADATVSGVRLTMHYIIFLPTPFGDALGTFFNNDTGTVQTNLKIYFEHNTAAVSAQHSGQTYGVGIEAGTTWPVGAVPSIQSNMAFRFTSAIGPLVQSVTSGVTIANGAVTAANFNGVSPNISGSIYGVPSNQYLVTPGANDIIANPGFTDTTRNFLAYDHAGLGNPLGTAWVTSHSYAVNDIVSHSVSGFFGGAVYNYTCTTAHTSGSTTEPGNGSAWAEDWNPTTESDIEASVLAGTPMTTNLINWITIGYGFNSAALHNAGSDGLDIGAGAWVPPAAGTNAGMSGNVRISGKAVIQ